MLLMIAGLLFISVAGYLILGISKGLVNDNHIGTVIVLVIVSTVSLTALLLSEPKRTPDGIYSVEIAQLSEFDKTSMQGSGNFLTFSINSNNERQYVVMCKYAKGWRREFLSQETTYVIESDTTPHVEFEQVVHTYPKWRSLPRYWGRVDLYHSLNGATIYIPTGSVICDYSIK